MRFRTRSAERRRRLERASAPSTEQAQPSRCRLAHAHHRHAGIYNDLGSGSNVDLCVITKERVELKRNVKYLQGKLYDRMTAVDYESRPPRIIKEKRVATLEDVDVVPGEPEAMEEG